MNKKELIRKICDQLLISNEDWLGGINLGQRWPKSSCHSDFLFSVLSELHARGFDRDEIDSNIFLEHVRELCTPKNSKGYVAKAIDRVNKHKQLNNIIASHLDQLFPEEVLLVDHTAVKSTLSSAVVKKTENTVKHDIINHEILDETKTREERYAAYLRKLDEESSEGKPIYNLTEEYGIKELIKDHPSLAPNKKIKGEDHE